MASIFIIGEKDDPQRLWIVDTAKGTVQPVTDASGPDKGTVATVQSMRRNGFAVVKGIDVAVAVPTAADLTSRQFSENG